MPSLLDLPPEILYNVLGEVVSTYIEKAITSPPVDGWETLDSELQSEWFTDEEDSDGQPDAEPDTAGEDDSDDFSTYFEVNDEIASAVSYSPLASYYDSEDAAASSMDDSFDGGATSLWVFEQGNQVDPQNMLEFRLYIWDVLEQREMLPRNDIAPLLSVSRYVREVTMKLLEDSLGVERTSERSLSRNPWPLLHFLRRHYRLAHTQPFELPPLQYPLRITPLVECYLRLADLAYNLRQMRTLIYMDPRDSQQEVYNMLNLSSIAEDIPQLVFQPRIRRRVHALLVHMRRFISVSMYCADITCAYRSIFSLKGTPQNPWFMIHEDKIPAFTKAIQAFAQFDYKHMDRKAYPELPGPLVDLTGVVKTLHTVKKLKYISEFRRKKEIMLAIAEASKLLGKWKLRAELSSYLVFEDS